MLVGTFFATFFQGILTVQAFIYYESFPEDPWLIKSLVALVWCLDLTHLFLICQACYHYLVDNWGNPAALAVSTIPLDLHLVLVGAATILCQAFFLNRVWTFSKKNYVLVGILTLMCMGTVGLDIAMSVQTSRNRSVTVFSSVTGEIIGMFSLGAGVDLIIAMLLCWYLQRGRTTFDKTNFVLTRIIQYTVATGLATSLLAIGCVAAYLIKPNSFIFIAMHFSLGRMYTNALLATLNSRRNLRASLGAVGGNVSWSTTGPSVQTGPTYVVSQTTAQDFALSDMADKSRVKAW